MGSFSDDFRRLLAARLGNEELAAKAVDLLATFEHETDATAPAPRSPTRRAYDDFLAQHGAQLADVDRRFQYADLHRQLRQFTDALAAEQIDGAHQSAAVSADDALAARNRIGELKGDAAWLAKLTDPHAPGHAEANAQLGQLLELTIEPTGGVK